MKILLKTSAIAAAAFSILLLPKVASASTPTTTSINYTGTENVTLDAYVYASGGGSSPTGTVGFVLCPQSGGQCVTACTASVDGSGSCTFNATTLRIGEYTIEGTYYPAAGSPYASSEGEETFIAEF